MSKGKLNPPRSVTVASTATLISDADKPWVGRILRNTDASASIYWGDSTVTASGATKGQELKAGEILSEDIIGDRIFGITASGTVVVSVVEIGH